MEDMDINWLNEIVAWVGDFKYIGMFLAGVGFFMPSAVIALVLGALEEGSLFGLALVGGLGGVFGAVLLYLVGYYFRNRDILKFIDGKRNIFGISKNSYTKAYNNVVKYGLLYVFISRSLPFVREASSLIVGYLKYNVVYVFVATFIGTVGYLYVLEYIGLEIGLNLAAIMKVTSILSISMFVIVSIGILIGIYFLRKKNLKKS